MTGLTNVGLRVLRAQINKRGRGKANGRMAGHILSELRRGLRTFCHTQRSEYFCLV
jgi:hypothetical protein